MPSSQQNVSARRRFPENNLSQFPLPLFAAADTSMQIPDPQIPKPARQLPPAEREDSIQKRQRPAEVNTVLTIALFYNGNEIALWTEDQKAQHTAKQKDLLKHGQVWCGGSGQEDLSRLPVMMQILMLECQSSRLCEVIFTIAVVHRNPVAFGDCHSAFHQSPMPSESEPMYVEPLRNAHVVSFKVCLCNTAFQGLKISPQAWGIHKHTKMNTMSYDQLYPILRRT